MNIQLDFEIHPIVFVDNRIHLMFVYHREIGQI